MERNVKRSSAFASECELMSVKLHQCNKGERPPHAGAMALLAIRATCSGYRGRERVQRWENLAVLRDPPHAPGS